MQLEGQLCSNPECYEILTKERIIMNQKLYGGTHIFPVRCLKCGTRTYIRRETSGRTSIVKSVK